MIILTNGIPPPCQWTMITCCNPGSRSHRHIRSAGTTSSYASELLAGFPAVLSAHCAHLSRDQDFPEITAILPPP